MIQYFCASHPSLEHVVDKRLKRPTLARGKRAAKAIIYVLYIQQTHEQLAQGHNWETNPPPPPALFLEVPLLTLIIIFLWASR